jgi:hypothetical protein
MAAAKILTFGSYIADQHQVVVRNLLEEVQHVHAGQFSIGCNIKKLAAFGRAVHSDHPAI